MPICRQCKKYSPRLNVDSCECCGAKDWKRLEIPDLATINGGDLRGIIRGRVLFDIFPAPGPSVADEHPKWPDLWTALRARYGLIGGFCIMLGTIVFWPFQILFWLLWTPFYIVWRISALKAILAAAIFGGIAFWLEGWRGLLVVCLFVWLFIQFHHLFTGRTRDKRERRSTDGS
jgi:hypothetical protein